MPFRLPLATTICLVATASFVGAQPPATVPATPPDATAPATPATTPPATPAAPNELPIVVTVDGTPIEFANGQGPVQRGGRILVPLRGIFEKLGAKVKYDPATQSIFANKADTNILLRLGGTTAVVNGTPRPLSAPAEIVGASTTVVPLRFVSEALGAKVKWDPASHTVLITTAEALAAAAAAGPAPGTPGTAPTTTPATTTTLAPDATVSGVVTAIDAGVPNLTVHLADPAIPDMTIGLTPDARVLEKRGDDAAVTTMLAKLHVGDQVTVRRNASGMAYDLEADYIEQKGAFKSVAPGDGGVNHLTFGDDTAVDLAPNAATVVSGNPAMLTDLKPPMLVTVRVNPISRKGIAVDAALPELKVATLTLMGADGVLRANTPVSVTLTGTPGARASVTIAGLTNVNDLVLSEVAATPGTYTGSFMVPPGFTLDKAAVTGALTLAGASAPAFTSPATLSVDSQPPAIADLEPAENGTITDRRPDIGGELSDLGTGIDPTQAQLMVNGVDVTAQTKVTKSHFLYHPTADLPFGASKMTITIKDMAGNVAQKDWAFNIIQPTSPIRIVTTTAPEGQVMLAGDSMKIRAEAMAGGTAKFSIGANVITGMMTEESPGVYTAMYFVQKGDSLTNAPVTVTFTPPGGGADVKLAASQPVTISAGPPVAPVIDAPLEGASTTEYLIISGHGTPNTTVRLTVSYAGKQIILNKEGNIASVDIKVGPDGKWESDYLTLDTHGASNATFTASAVTVLKDAEISPPAVVHFKK